MSPSKNSRSLFRPNRQASNGVGPGIHSLLRLTSIAFRPGSSLLVQGVSQLWCNFLPHNSQQEDSCMCGLCCVLLSCLSFSAWEKSFPNFGVLLMKELGLKEPWAYSSNESFLLTQFDLTESACLCQKHILLFGPQISIFKSSNLLISRLATNR